MIVMNDSLQFVQRCTRVEVVDKTGRAYVNYNDDNKVEMSLQDGGKTLKIFITSSLPLKEQLKKEIEILNKMVLPADNNLCSIDSIREQQGIVDDLIDKIK